MVISNVNILGVTPLVGPMKIILLALTFLLMGPLGIAFIFLLALYCVLAKIDRKIKR